MKLKTIKSVIKRYRRQSCKWKRNYNIITVIFRWIELTYKKSNVRIYKCKFGNHYHVGRYTAQTRKSKKRYARAIFHKQLLEAL